MMKKKIELNLQKFCLHCYWCTAIDDTMVWLGRRWKKAILILIQSGGSVRPRETRHCGPRKAWHSSQQLLHVNFSTTKTVDGLCHGVWGTPLQETFFQMSLVSACFRGKNTVLKKVLVALRCRKPPSNETHNRVFSSIQVSFWRWFLRHFVGDFFPMSLRIACFRRKTRNKYHYGFWT